MDPPFFHGGTLQHRPAYNDTSMQEGAWSLDPSVYAYAIVSHQHASTQDSLSSDGTNPPAYNPDLVQGCILLSNFNYSHENPMGPMGIANVPHVDIVYNPPPYQLYQKNPSPSPPSPEEIPQHPYECGNTQRWDRKSPILFSKNGRPGVKLVDALDKTFEGIDDRDGFPLGEESSGITMRMHFPGYRSTKEVEKILKSNQRGNGRSMQVSTRDYTAQRNPVTKSKLVYEVSKRITWHIEDLLKHHDLFPFDCEFEERWRLGQGMMKAENMIIIGLKNVSRGSWSPIIGIVRPSGPLLGSHPDTPSELL